MKKLILSFVAVFVTILGLGGVATISPAYALDGDNKGGVGQYIDDIKPDDMPDGGEKGLMGLVATIINIVVGIVGVIAVVMMIVGGINFITSQGDTAKVTKARNTVLYGVVGLIVALLAFAIVNFVLTGVLNAESVILFGL